MINRTSVLCAISLSLVVSSTAFAQMDTATPAAPSGPATAPAAPAPTTPAPVTPPVALPVTPADASATSAAPAGERPSTYTIVSGDTLWSISHKFDTTIKALQKENNLKPHALLHIGQVIKIPAATAPKAAN